MQSENHLFGDLAKLFNGAAGTLAGVGREAEANANASHGPLGKLGGGPDDVAQVIEKAVAARRPRARYRVTASANVLIAQRRLLPDRAWDRMIRTAFPRP